MASPRPTDSGERSRARGVVIAGNWKMNLGPLETRGFVSSFGPAVASVRRRVILFPPSLSFAAARDALRVNTPISLGVQNIHWELAGAFTGEISAEMAAEAGATYVLVGHSERRHVFGETDGETALKVGAALRAGLVPVLCIGETLEERERGRLEEVVFRQLDAVLESEVSDGLASEREAGPPLLVAYEPVWAIGTGRTATPSDAANAHGLVRARLSGSRGSAFAESIPILYGGSVKPDNADELLAAPDVDGVLVGGASLDPKSFARIALIAG